jgi:type I restriction enzyme, R subunit
VPELKISEAGTVQFPIVAHAAAIGWTAIPPDVALQKRGGEAGMLFRDATGGRARPVQSVAIGGCNPAAHREIGGDPSTVEGNREMLSWLRGERQWYDEADRTRWRV